MAHINGLHVVLGPRDGFDQIAGSIAGMVVVDDFGVLDNPHLRDGIIVIIRTQLAEAEGYKHIDSPVDFDRIADEEPERWPEVAEFYWKALKTHYGPVKQKYGDRFELYFQPTNEINRPEIVDYNQELAKLATRDGYRLALFGDAGGSPPIEVFEKHYVPFLKGAQKDGHAYCGHAYTGVPKGSSPYASDLDHTNPGYPLRLKEIMKKNGIDMPYFIGEFGYNGGYGDYPPGWFEDATAYAKNMQKAGIDLICHWTTGSWEGS